MDASRGVAATQAKDARRTISAWHKSRSSCPNALRHDSAVRRCLPGQEGIRKYWNVRPAEVAIPAWVVRGVYVRSVKVLSEGHHSARRFGIPISVGIGMVGFNQDQDATESQRLPPFLLDGGTPNRSYGCVGDDPRDTGRKGAP